MNDVRLHGPIFDGRAENALENFIEAAKLELGNEGVNRVEEVLGAVLQNPTGFYESQIVTDRRGDNYEVHDSGVVYGPWLEGVSSRNSRSKFKGYQHFRRVTQDLQDEADKIAEEILEPFLRRMQ